MRFKVLIVLQFIILFSYGQVKIGEWKDHLSYNSCNTIVKVGSEVYVSNGVGLLKYSTSDNSITRINKSNGLSDIGINLLRYNPFNNTLLIIYENANIDILKDNEFINFSDIKRKSITGKKIINEVIFNNNIAYLSCGFGIIVFDTDKLEVKDTYYIGPGGSYVNVFQMEYTDTTLIAATSVGLLKARTSSLLNNFQSWSAVSGLPSGTYNGIVKYKNMLVANYSPYAANGTQNQDTLYKYSSGIWSKYTVKPFPYFNTKLFPQGNYLCMLENYGYEVYDSNENRIAYISQYPFGNAFIKDVCPDFSASKYWIADKYNGFIESYGPHPFYPNKKININGTHSNYISNIDVYEGKLFCSPTKIDETGTSHYSREGINHYNGTEWSYIKESVYDSIMDYCFVYQDRKDPSRFWASSWLQGLCEYKNGQLVNVFNGYNATIPYLPAFPFWHRVAGLSMDETGNLWIAGSDVQNFLTVRKANGSFQNFNFNSISPYVGRVHADKHNQVWVLFPRGNGMLVYKNNNFSAPNSSNYKFLNTSEGNGKLPDLYVFSIAEDLDDKIWIGTSKGVAVFYNPENVFSGANFDCQQILITQDGHVQILLETEKINAIAVDGANRKWIGTEASGVYCFSPDGQQEIYHFTAENSPLFSNLIIDLAYDEISGDVYIGSDQGMQSYRTLIVRGEEKYNNVHAYPNPVKPGYNGNVYIKGLMNESVVKITDINSNLVYEVKSQGGQIEWPLKNLSGQRVAPGVYLAYCALSDGATSAVTKILVLN